MSIQLVSSRNSVKEKGVSFVSFYEKRNKRIFTESLVHNKGTNITGCSAHQSRREFICSLWRWKAFQAFCFSLCGTRTGLLQMPAHREMPSFQIREKTCHRWGKWQVTILLNVRKKHLIPFCIETTHTCVSKWKICGRKIGNVSRPSLSRF